MDRDTSVGKLLSLGRAMGHGRDRRRGDRRGHRRQTAHLNRRSSSLRCQRVDGSGSVQGCPARGSDMTNIGHLWAIGYDDMGRAAQVRDEITRMAEGHHLILLDVAVVVRYPDGSVTLDGEPFLAPTPIRRRTFASFLAGLALGAPPLTSGAVGALLRGTGTAAGVGISDDFVSEVEGLMKPGTSALFVLDQEGDMDAILQGIRGLGGTVLRTNVHLERAKLIQLTLAAASADTIEPDSR